MPVEPTYKITNIPAVKRQDNAKLPQERKPKEPKKNEKKEPGKIDIKV
jgi:hypothetical protein